MRIFFVKISPRPVPGGSDDILEMDTGRRELMEVSNHRETWRVQPIA